MDFIHLNIHSHYSRGWGIGTISDICLAAREHGMKRIALTDTNGLYGLLPFIQTAKEMDIEPIVGSEIISNRQRAILLVKNKPGYANLCNIISDCHCNHDFDLVRHLRTNRNGLIILSDDFRLLKALKQDMKEDLFVEMSPGYRMAPCYAFSRKTGIPPVATNRVFLVKKDQFRLHCILRAISLNTKLSRLTRDDTCSEHNFLNSPHEMVNQFPHAPMAVSNTLKTVSYTHLTLPTKRIV